MRKIGFYLLMLLAMVMVISCGNDKKSNKEEKPMFLSHAQH